MMLLFHDFSFGRFKILLDWKIYTMCVGFF